MGGGRVGLSSLEDGLPGVSFDRVSRETPGISFVQVGLVRAGFFDQSFQGTQQQEHVLRT